MNQFARLAASCRHLLARLRTDRRGNVMMILGFAMIPMTFGVGFGIDYTRAMRLKTRMDAAADAAALAAVNVTAMQKDDATAKEAARNMFNAQVAGLKGLIYTSGTNNPKIDITSDGGVNSGRTVTVSYIAQSRNIFSGVLGNLTLPVEGAATATATRAPHIDFYLLMDTSPSMLLPTTQTGIDALVNATKHSQAKSGGCAFACHTQKPNYDNIIIRGAFDDGDSTNNVWLDKSGDTCTLKSNGYPGSGSGQKVTCTNNKQYVSRDGMFERAIWVNNAGGSCAVKAYSGTTVTCWNGTTTYNTANGQLADTYWLVRNYNAVYGQNPTIRLRIDDEQAAAQQLIPFANTTANNNKVTYRLQLFSFDFTPEGGSHPVRTITAGLNDVKNMTSYTIPDFYAAQTNWFQQSCPTQNYCINDMGTEADNALTRMNTLITPSGTVGDGSTTANPQKVLFIITDGVVDESQGGNRRHREFSDAVNIADCTTLKNRGIRIAILYTEYSSAALESDSWSKTNVQPYLPNVPVQLKKCASTRLDGTPLFYQVSTDESIPQALSTLFALTVQTARLTK